MLDRLSKDHLLSWSLINSNVVDCSRPPRGFEMDSDFCRDPGRPHRQQSVGHCVQGGLIKSLVTDSDSGWLRREVDCSLFPPALFLHISMNFTIFLSLIFFRWYYSALDWEKELNGCCPCFERNLDQSHIRTKPSPCWRDQCWSRHLSLELDLGIRNACGIW